MPASALVRHISSDRYFTRMRAAGKFLYEAGDLKCKRPLWPNHGLRSVDWLRVGNGSNVRWTCHGSRRWSRRQKPRLPATSIVAVECFRANLRPVFVAGPAVRLPAPPGSPASRATPDSALRGLPPGFGAPFPDARIWRT